MLQWSNTKPAFSPQTTNQTTCKLETKRSEFKIFVNAILDFVQLINTGNWSYRGFLYFIII